MICFKYKVQRQKLRIIFKEKFQVWGLMLLIVVMFKFMVWA
jgi:hypothetical protein